MNQAIPRQPAPPLDVATLDGNWQLSDRRPDKYTLIVVYRGLHCPICKTQLREIDRKLDKFADRGVEVIAVSSDTEERARKTKDKWGIERLPIGFGLDEEQGRAWGLYVSAGINDAEPERFFEPGLFLVRPDGTLYAASIQSMPFARPALDDILGALDFIDKNDYPARGEIAS